MLHPSLFDVYVLSNIFGALRRSSTAKRITLSPSHKTSLTLTLSLAVSLLTSVIKWHLWVIAVKYANFKSGMWKVKINPLVYIDEDSAFQGCKKHAASVHDICIFSGYVGSLFQFILFKLIRTGCYCLEKKKDTLVILQSESIESWKTSLPKKFFLIAVADDKWLYKKVEMH